MCIEHIAPAPIKSSTQLPLLAFKSEARGTVSNAANKLSANGTHIFMACIYEFVVYFGDFYVSVW